jgi:xylulokinase
LTVLLGIDIGSTAMKAAAFDERGGPLAAVRLEYRKPVQGADDWWRTAVRAVRQLLRTKPELTGEITGIGLSGRGGTRVFLDRGGRPIPFPPGFAVSAEAMARAVELAGSRRGPHGLRFLASILQLRESCPREFALTSRAMVAKDYVVFQMTGHAVTDPASGPDLEAWPQGVVEAPELEHVRLSEVRWPWVAAGRLREPVAAQLGLEPGIVVATGAHDGAAATVGAGAAHAGAHSVTLGTNAVYRMINDDASREQSRFWTVLPGLMAYGADVTLGGYAVDWVIRMLGGSHERLSAEASRLTPGSDGVTFLPQMGGRVLPNPNASVSAAFAGIKRSTRREHLYRAVLEGNAFALRGAREALLAQGLPDGEIYLTGGGTRSPLWRQILAAVFGRSVHWSGVEEGCRGGAIFAAVAAGVYPDVGRAMEAMAGATQSVDPGAQASAYEAAYERFVSVRGALDDV